MNIPAEAVEAAARRFFSKWDELPESSKEHFYPDVRAILEAAAPHIQEALADSRDGDLFRFTWAQREWLRGKDAV